MTATQRTPEWYEARKGRVTASSVGGILGLSPFTTRAQVMRAMVREACGAPSEFPDPAPPPVAWGNAMESQALIDFEFASSERVTPAPFVPHEDWLGASPDGYVSDGRLLEIKCPYALRSDPNPIFKHANEQPHYLAQMQVQMFVTGYESCWFFQWTPHGSQQTLIHRDDDWLATNIPALRQFYAEFLYEMQENLDEHLAPARREIDTPQAHKMVTEWDELVEAIERATERKADLLKEMVALCGDADALFAGRKLTKVEKEGSVSYAKALKALCPCADVEPYRGKPSSHWRLS